MQSRIQNLELIPAALITLAEAYRFLQETLSPPWVLECVTVTVIQWRQGDCAAAKHWPSASSFVHVFQAVGLELGNEWQMLLFIAPGLKIKSVGMSHVRVLQKKVYFKPQKGYGVEIDRIMEEYRWVDQNPYLPTCFSSHNARSVLLFLPYWPLKSTLQ